MVEFMFQHFQKDIVRGAEGYIVTGSKQVEIGEFAALHLVFEFFGFLTDFSTCQFCARVSYLTGTKLSEDSRKYGSENTCTSGNTLTKAALSYGRARVQIEKERGDLLKALGIQVWLTYSLFTDYAYISRL